MCWSTGTSPFGCMHASRSCAMFFMSVIHFLSAPSGRPLLLPPARERRLHLRSPSEIFLVSKRHRRLLKFNFQIISRCQRRQRFRLPILWMPKAAAASMTWCVSVCDYLPLHWLGYCLQDGVNIFHTPHASLLFCTTILQCFVSS